MSTDAIDADVCVIGGGPAGAAFGTRMARLGYDAAVVERAAFPRPRIGEALTPGVWALLEALGLGGTLEAAGFLPTTAARVRWIDDEVRRVSFTETPPRVAVDRGRFDAVLLDAARTAGARILQPATALTPRRTAQGWEVPVSSLAGTVTVRASFVAHAGGRASAPGRASATSPPMLALHGIWHGRPKDLETRVEAGRDAWFWGAHLPGGGLRAMAFMDVDLLRRRGVRKAGVERFYRELLADTDTLRGLDGARLAGPVRACSATTYADDEPIGEADVKLGEAAFAIDPLSSSGVEQALQTALAGSVAAHTVLSRGGDAEAARAFYRESVRAAVRRHADWAAAAYGHHRRHRDALLWQRRTPTATEPPGASRGAGLGDLSTRPVRLTAGVELASTPCIVGERVERRPALSAPTLARPVAYLGGIEIAPLVATIDGTRTLEELLHGWSASMPYERAVAIAGWLHRAGLIADVRSDAPVSAPSRIR